MTEKKDMWAQIKNAGDMVDHDKLKVLLYAPTKQGKSRACALFGERPLIGLCEQQAVVTIKRANPKASIFQIHNARDLADFRSIAMSKEARDRFDAICLDGITDDYPSKRQTSASPPAGASRVASYEDPADPNDV